LVEARAPSLAFGGFAPHLVREITLRRIMCAP
jgi:hypothetical protein